MVRPKDRMSVTSFIESSWVPRRLRSGFEPPDDGGLRSGFTLRLRGRTDVASRVIGTDYQDGSESLGDESFVGRKNGEPHSQPGGKSVNQPRNFSARDPMGE